MVTMTHTVSTNSVGVPSSQHLHRQLFPDTHAVMTGTCAKHWLEGCCLHIEDFSCSQSALIVTK